MVRNIKSKKGNAGVVAMTLLGVVAVGAVGYTFMGNDIPTGDINDNTQDTIQGELVLTDLVSGNGNYTVRSTYNPSTKLYDYEIHVDSANVVGGSNFEFNSTIRNDMPTGSNIHDFSMIQEVDLGLNGDFKLNDINGSSRIIISEDNSRVNGERGSSKVTFVGTQTQVVPYSYAMNPHSVVMSSIADLESSTDEVEKVLDFGTKNKVTLVIKG